MAIFDAILFIAVQKYITQSQHGLKRLSVKKQSTHRVICVYAFLQYNKIFEMYQEIISSCSYTR